MNFGHEDFKIKGGENGRCLH